MKRFIFLFLLQLVALAIPEKNYSQNIPSQPAKPTPATGTIIQAHPIKIITFNENLPALLLEMKDSGIFSEGKPIEERTVYTGNKPLLKRFNNLQLYNPDTNFSGYFKTLNGTTLSFWCLSSKAYLIDAKKPNNAYYLFDPGWAEIFSASAKPIKYGIYKIILKGLNPKEFTESSNNTMVIGVDLANSQWVTLGN